MFAALRLGLMRLSQRQTHGRDSQPYDKHQWASAMVSRSEKALCIQASGLCAIELHKQKIRATQVVDLSLNRCALPVRNIF
jgi:hypothetical protein